MKTSSNCRYSNYHRARKYFRKYHNSLRTKRGGYYRRSRDYDLYEKYDVLAFERDKLVTEICFKGNTEKLVIVDHSYKHPEVVGYLKGLWETAV